MYRAFAEALAFVCIGTIVASPAHAEATQRTDWLRDAHWGVFTHYLTAPETSAEAWNSQADTFDVSGLAKQLEDAGVRYYVITLGQNSGHFCSPNATYDKYTGVQPSKCSRRDLVADLSTALAPRNIRLMLYLPCQTPNRDVMAQKGFGLPQGPKDQPIDKAFANKWAEVIREWSTRYGRNISGWWFDGAYKHVRFNKEIARIYAEAVRKGNPDAIIAFNPGVMIKDWSKAEDYTAGEINVPERVKCDGRWVGKEQWHMLSFLGPNWGQGPPRFSDEQVAQITRDANAKEGVVTWDVPIQASGLIPKVFTEQLAALHKALTGPLERVTLSVEPKVLNPVRDKNAKAVLSLRGCYNDGSSGALPLSDALITARTRQASGHVDVISMDDGKAVPKEGGIATIEATIAQDGHEFKASTDIVVAPFYRDYHQTLVMKLFLGMEGEPVERLEREPLFQKPHDVLCTFEEAIEVIRKADNLTRGIPKIIYLVGWQKGGHDHGYPAWDDVNPRLKRAQDASALDSLRWLIREARQYHTTVSLHINMVDAYQQSPLWDEYVAKDCLARDEQGQLLVAGIQMKGEPMYNVVYPKEWEAGLAQRRIDSLIAMIPELTDGHTIHVDVFIAQREGGKPISPWHAKPESGGLTPDRYVETQRKIFHYWRDRGFDVTGEGIFWAHPPGEGFTGLQPMSWWYPDDKKYQMDIPERLMARGRTDRGGDGDFRFGSSMHGEEIWQKDRVNMPGFLGMFCRTTLPWYYLSRFERVRFADGALYYGDGVVARTESGKKIIRKGDFILREDDDLFVPALWREKEIIASSRLGYRDRSWLLPEDWRDVKKVDLFTITSEGLTALKKHVRVKENRLFLSLGADETISVLPAEER